MNNILHWLVKIPLSILAALPLKAHYAISRFIAWLAGSVIRYRKTEVIANIARAFPYEDYSFVKKTAKLFYRHFGELVAEAVWFGGCRNAGRLRKSHIMEIVNPDEFNRLYDIAPSVLVMYSHAGNWELYGGIENYSEKPLRCTEDNFCVVYKKTDSPLWDGIMKENRFAPLHDRKNFPGYIETMNFVRYVFTHRNEKKIYNVNTDQRPYIAGSDNIAVNFMGQAVTTMSASAAVAKKFSMAVCFLSMSKPERGRYKLEYRTICEDASKMSVQEIMDRYYAMLEEDIRKEPFNYLWTHRRWARY